jgi:hypothetical protein
MIDTAKFRRQMEEQSRMTGGTVLFDLDSIREHLDEIDRLRAVIAELLAACQHNAAANPVTYRMIEAGCRRFQDEIFGGSK